MTSEESAKALGMMKTSDALKQKLANESFDFNRNTQRLYGDIFNELFCIFMWEEEERREHRLSKRRREETEMAAITSSKLNVSSSSSITSGNSVSTSGDVEIKQTKQADQFVASIDDKSLVIEYKQATEQALGKFDRARQMRLLKINDKQSGELDRLKKIDAIIQRQQPEPVDDNKDI